MVSVWLWLGYGCGLVLAGFDLVWFRFEWVGSLGLFWLVGFWFELLRIGWDRCDSVWFWLGWGLWVVFGFVWVGLVGFDFDSNGLVWFWVGPVRCAFDSDGLVRSGSYLVWCGSDSNYSSFVWFCLDWFGSVLIRTGSVMRWFRLGSVWYDFDSKRFGSV